MIEVMYKYRYEIFCKGIFSDEFNEIGVPFEMSLNKEQVQTFHKIIDYITAANAAQTKDAYTMGFKDGAAMMKEVQED